jgi:hypothetical protein
MATKIKNDEEKLAHPFAMAKHLSSGGYARKMTIPEQISNDGGYRCGKDIGYTLGRIESAKIRFGKIIERYMPWLPEGYRDEFRDLCISRLSAVNRNDPWAEQNALADVARYARETRECAEALGIKIPGPLDIEGQLPPRGLFTAKEMRDARRE